MDADRELAQDASGGLDRRLFVSGGVGAALALPHAARAATTFPARPLVIMAPANPGGGWDQLARLMQHVIAETKLSPRPMEVMNRGGAGGAIGLAELVSRKHGDPYMIMAAGAVMIGSTIAQNSPFRVTDTDPLARLIIEHLVVAVPPDSPYRTLPEFIAAFRKDPSTFSWCGGSAGGVDHILVGLIAEAAGVPASAVRYVAYSGGGAASAAIMGSQVTAGVAGYGEWKGLADDGRLRFLGVASEQPLEGGKIPTLQQSGLNVVLQNWRAVFAPPGLAPEHRAWWMDVITRMHATPLWRGYLQSNGWGDGWLIGSDLRRFVEAEQVTNGRTLARLGIAGSKGGQAPMGPWAVPAVIAVAGAAAVGVVAWETARAKGAIAPAGLEDDDEGGGQLPIWNRFFIGAGLVAAYIAALALVGFLIATPVFIVALCALMRSKNLLRDAISGLLITGGVWLLFSKLLSIHLP